MNKKRKITLIIIALLLLAGIIQVIRYFMTEQPLHVTYTVLKKSALLQTNSVEGLVESVDKANVYTTLNYPIYKIHVKIGEQVKKGQTLSELDTTDLRLSIAQQKAELEQIQQNNLNQLENSRRVWSEAVNNYEDARNASDDDSSKPVELAKFELDQAKLNYDQAKTNYNQAKLNMDAAKSTAVADIEKLINKLTNAKTTSNVDAKLIAIKRLEPQLAQSTIKSPIDGTVTAVYAKEGASRPGLLFVIEDTQHLKIMAKVKEYDIGGIREGMPVIIKTDMAEDKEFYGKVSSIHPTAIKNENAETLTVPDIEFVAEVEAPQNTNLRIGMNARLSIVMDKREQVFSLPYDVVRKNGNGDNVVYAVEQKSQNKFYAKQIKVTTGLETDFKVEVSGDELSEGMKIINDASHITSGMQIGVIDQFQGDD